MDEVINKLEHFGISVWLMVAGFFGAFLSLQDKEGLTKRDKAVSLLAGVLIANYLTPLIFDLLNINDNAMGGVGFLLGYTGLETIKLLISFIKKKLKKHE
jgi:hypothetical protein